MGQSLKVPLIQNIYNTSFNTTCVILEKEKLDYNWTGSLEDTSYFTTMLHADMKAVACSASFYYAAFWRNISMPLDVKRKLQIRSFHLLCQISSSLRHFKFSGNKTEN